MRPGMPTSLEDGTANMGFAQTLDAIIGVLSPTSQERRMQARANVERLKLSYEAARPGRDRAPPESIRGPDNIGHQLDSIAMIARSEELARNSVFIGTLIERYKMHVVGNLQYIPTVGDRRTNDKYREFLNGWAKNCDITGRFHFVDQIGYGLSGSIVQGDHGFIHHHNDDGTFQIQNVEGENIGNPRQVVTTPNCIRGVVIENGKPVAYRIYRQTISSQFVFVAEIPAALFSHLNPVERSDEYKAKPAFHAVLNDAHDIRQIEKAWLKKIQWAGYKIAVVNTTNGAAPVPSTNLLDTPTTSPVYGRAQGVSPGEVLYGDPGMQINMVDNKTPNANEMELVESKMAQIAAALHLPLPFVWVVMGMPGTYTRLIGEQASRTFQDGPRGQNWLKRVALEEIKNKALVSGIIRGEIPWTKDWNKGEWMFPARSSVDVGRESDANLKENAQGMRSMRRICTEDGVYWQDEDRQLAVEAQNKIELAIAKAADIKANTGVDLTWQDVMPHIQMMGPNPMPAPDKEAPTSLTETTPTKLQAKSAKTQLSAYVEDMRFKSLDKDVQADILRFVDAVDSTPLVHYGMTVKELLAKADQANLKNARSAIGTLRPSRAMDEVMSRVKEGSKYVLIMNDRIVDGHHFLAKAERAGITSSLNVLDLTPARIISHAAP